ncbi:MULTISPECIES: ATP-binding protein [Flavobacteriaceae]|uniref:Histidine kinase/DNA gyrase B/HSP90-like ATPase n=1 Tax=Marinirhabdus gelatinilytica TaxID=1703343 RepID=A0A370QKW5_9FLAO|nr:MULTISPECIES: ATP-binding protein [Flavobacteriaceae]RDK88982.1 histidine kinase/DNA gyrase B/HSP90-like ATPase [Marinirhabdus gelatinilytica]
MSDKIDLSIDAGRLLFGLSRIGYTTSAAICDIIDNSVRANANNINLLIKKEREDFSDNKRNNVKEYIIIDDGDGMDEGAIEEALKLGSTDDHYDDKSLSKFGLGLKSASFSQGDVLKVISSDGTGFNKYEVSLPKVMEAKEYFAEKTEIEENESELIETYLKDGKGTIIIISAIRLNNHPSVRNTIKELKTKVGVIYFYFLSESGVNITIGDKKIDAIDPLFVSEANENGNLNENEWDGTEVRWIEKPKELTLDDELKINVTIEITQLPYPPIYRIKNIGESRDKEVRERYLIEAGNYGFYVYRNKRLISWASNLQGIIPYDQDFYAFRGRILINDEADDFFNIDVKKSSLTLSEEAFRNISDFTKEAKSKSKAAWKNAGKISRDIINKAPNEIANKLLDEFEQIEILPGDDLPDEEIALERLKAITDDMTSKIKWIIKMMKEDKGEEVDDTVDDDYTEDEKEEAIKGEKNANLTKIFRVSSVEDNLLWEPYYDTDLGNCVRINKIHRFARLIYEDNAENRDLQILFDLMMLQFADSELYAYKNIGKYEYDDLKVILRESRRIVSEFLANMCRKLENDLPPNYSDEKYA